MRELNHTGGKEMAHSLLDRHVSGPVSAAALGSIVERTDIRSSLVPFQILPNYTTTYPEVVIKAIGNLYEEYNRAFAPLVAANREWETDYHHCTMDGVAPVNWGIQIDMVGLPETLLQEIEGMPEEEVREILRNGIFEMESSIASYQFFENMFLRNGRESFFKTRFRAWLDYLRRRFGR